MWWAAEWSQRLHVHPPALPVPARLPWGGGQCAARLRQPTICGRPSSIKVRRRLSQGSKPTPLDSLAACAAATAGRGAGTLMLPHGAPPTVRYHSRPDLTVLMERLHDDLGGFRGPRTATWPHSPEVAAWSRGTSAAPYKMSRIRHSLAQLDAPEAMPWDPTWQQRADSCAASPDVHAGDQFGERNAVVPCVDSAPGPHPPASPWPREAGCQKTLVLDARGRGGPPLYACA